MRAFITYWGLPGVSGDPVTAPAAAEAGVAGAVEGVLGVPFAPVLALLLPAAAACVVDRDAKMMQHD